MWGQGAPVLPAAAARCSARALLRSRRPRPSCPEPVACGKVFAHQITVNYREAYGPSLASTVSSSITRAPPGETFVTRKTTRAAARIKVGLQDKLFWQPGCAS